MLNEQAVLQTTSQAAAQSVLVQPGFLKIEKLAKTYVADKPVFAGVSFTVARGEFVCIIGHSGCGKTTVLNVLAGLDTATEGHAFMDGREIAGPSLERGVVFQSHALMPWLTVRQNIAFAVKSKWLLYVTEAEKEVFIAILSKPECEQTLLPN